MAGALKFITALTDGTRKLVSGITSSAGGADANKVIATNGSGVLDVSFLPPGVEVQVRSVPSTDDFVAGDFVNIYDNAGTDSARFAVANDITRRAHGYVLASSTTGDIVDVYVTGVNNQVTGTANVEYYLSSTTPGAATATAPAQTTNHFLQVLGHGDGNGIKFEYDQPICFE